MSDEIYTVIVADDEPDIREAMCQMVDWESAGFRLLGSAGNGMDALQMVEQLQPDLLLTDIEMPFVTGTELAKQVRQLQPLIQIAFLSGYDDFEYAQSAIENQVIAYLLKPLSMTELAEELRSIHKKMRARFQELCPPPGHLSRHVITATLLLDEFAAFSDEAVIQQQLYDCGLVFTEPYSLAVLSVGGTADFDQSAAQTVERTLLKHYSCCAVASGGRVLCLVISEDGFARLNTALDELHFVGKRLLAASLSIGVSQSFTRLGQCHAACREAVDAQMLAEGSGIDRRERPRTNTGPAEANHAAKIEQLLLSGDRQGFQLWLRDVFEGTCSDYEAINLLFAAQEVIRRHLGEQDIQQLLRRHGLDNPIEKGMKREEIRQKAVDFCLEGADRIREGQKKGMDVLCERALSIIDREYMDEALSLSTVSEQLHVSPNYLSANMKRYAGETFINILIKRRMEAAALLLQDKNLKIAEISRSCGYSDQHYFSYCFKKYYGISPSARRREEQT